MKLEMMFIGALFLGLIMITGSTIIGEGLSRYNVESDTTTTFGRVSYSLKSVYDYQDSMKENIQGGDVTDQDAVDQMLAGGYTSIRNQPFNALTAATNTTMILAMESGFISADIIGFFIAVISILVLFAIIALIFKFEQR